jgi:hypothetical protein
MVLGSTVSHDNIFVFSKTITCFEMGPPLRREGGSDCWSLTLYWGWLERALSHSLTNWSSPPHTHGIEHELSYIYNFGSDRRENTASNSSSVVTLLSLCVCICIPRIVARQRLGKHVSAATNTHEELLDGSFSMRSCGPYHIKGKYAFSSSRNFLL